MNEIKGRKVGMAMSFIGLRLKQLNNWSPAAGTTGEVYEEVWDA